MKTYVMIPTYNERENIGKLIQEILHLNIPDLHVVVVDDNSPDGTAGEVKKYITMHPEVELLLRTTNRGRGSAGVAGFQYTLDHGAECVVEMDADFSHHPRYIPDMLNAIQNADLVIGSRFVSGGRDVNRGIVRRLVTFLAGVYVRILLGLKINDVSSGYRCFRRKVLEDIQLDSMISTGPSIVSEVFYKAHVKGFSIREIPIEFEDRIHGETKLNYKVLLKTLLMVLKFKRLHKKGLLFKTSGKSLEI
ncbi:MAG: dolichyl-phosphate beta-D-mannosyltransferase [Candidatus Kuenenia stuttgartiensis]|jgi:dolichol-phosphate mannosyltransferase|nr:MAG: dolichyl-phosphate beta-D-mannosyltransferase [Candidatus Kuenenia stuttgartiensis]